MKLKKIFETCGFHCIKINNLGVSFGEQVVLKDVNLFNKEFLPLCEKAIGNGKQTYVLINENEINTI